MTDPRQTLLICTSDPIASRALVTRSNLDVRWAQTIDDAVEALRETACAVCVTSKPFARAVLAECAKAEREIATIVVLDPDDWSLWRDYYQLGATTVVRARAKDDLMKAVTRATGLAFRAAARVPFETEARFAHGTEGGTWRTIDVSVTGLCIEGFPPLALGAEVDLAIHVGSRWFEVTAIIARISRQQARRVVGLEFCDLAPELRTHLDELVRAQRRREMDSAHDEYIGTLDDSTVLVLRNTIVQRDVLGLCERIIVDPDADTRLEVARIHAEILDALCKPDLFDDPRAR